MNIYTVSFFGHRYIDSSLNGSRSKQVKIAVPSYQEVNILFLRYQVMQELVKAVFYLRSTLYGYGYGNTHFTLVLPYMKAEYRDNEKEYLDYYDEVEICAESSEAHPKSAIQVRNRSMIDRADLVVCCIQHKSGGAYATIRYAEKQSKKIVNLADEN